MRVSSIVVGVAVALWLAGMSSSLGQPNADGSDPEWVAGFPEPQRVLDAMRTGDVYDTESRQMAAFTYLNRMIETLMTRPEDGIIPRLPPRVNALFVGYREAGKTIGAARNARQRKYMNEHPEVGSIWKVDEIEGKGKLDSHKLSEMTTSPFRTELIGKVFPPGWYEKYLEPVERVQKEKRDRYTAAEQARQVEYDRASGKTKREEDAKTYFMLVTCGLVCGLPLAVVTVLVVRRAWRPVTLSSTDPLQLNNDQRRFVIATGRAYGTGGFVKNSTNVSTQTSATPNLVTGGSNVNVSTSVSTSSTRFVEFFLRTPTGDRGFTISGDALQLTDGQVVSCVWASPGGFDNGTERGGNVAWIKNHNSNLLFTYYDKTARLFVPPVAIPMMLVGLTTFLLLLWLTCIGIILALLAMPAYYFVNRSIVGARREARFMREQWPRVRDVADQQAAALPPA